MIGSRLAASMLALTAAIPAVAPAAPSPESIPALAASLAGRLAGRTFTAPDGSAIAAGTILDAARAEACLRTIGRAGGWPASWLVVQDRTKPYDLVLHVVLVAEDALADPEPAFLAARRDWDEHALEEAVRAATGTKMPRERNRSLVVQSFTTKVATRYVYDLPKTGKEGKGLFALLPEGSLLREATAVELGDGARHTLAIVLVRPTFVPADCSTETGRKTGHRDEGGILLVLAGEHALEDSLDITGVVREATGGDFLPRFACAEGDTEAGAIDRLVESRFERRESVRLLDLARGRAESALDGLPVRVGVKRDGSRFAVFAEPAGR